MATYVPSKGDLIAISFDSQSGHEQRGGRPALVVSNDLLQPTYGALHSLSNHERAARLPLSRANP